MIAIKLKTQAVGNFRLHEPHSDHNLVVSRQSNGLLEITNLSFASISTNKPSY